MRNWAALQAPEINGGRRVNPTGSHFHGVSTSDDPVASISPPRYLPQSSSKCPKVQVTLWTTKIMPLCLLNIIYFPMPHNCEVSSAGPLVKGILGDPLSSRRWIACMALEVPGGNSPIHCLCTTKVLFNNTGAQRDFWARVLGPANLPCRMTEVSPLGSMQSFIVSFLSSE